MIEKLNTSPVSRRKLMIAAAALMLQPALWSAGANAADDPVTLVAEARPVSTVVVARDAPEFTRLAAEELVRYLQEISGARVSIVNDPEEVTTGATIWVGSHPELKKRHAGVDLSLTKPEETLIQTAGKDLIILGRDVVAPDGTQVEGGTHLAVSSFIEDQLGVRWLWPGKLGTDIPKRPDIRVEPVAKRYAPQARLRSIRLPNIGRAYKGLKDPYRKILAHHVDDPAEWARQRDREAREWLNHHRGDAPATGETINCLAGTWSNYPNRHGFAPWYGRYGARHPDWFAMQPDGTRTPYPRPDVAKLCVSNPEVAEQWVKNAVAFFKANPNATTFEAAENDYGWEGYCVCENCLAMDNKGAEILERELRWKGTRRRSYALTDRYAKFWNIIARRLKEELPGRDVNVGAYAYHPTRPAPTIALEENVIPAFVGLERRFYNRNSDEHTLEQREMWRKWWEAAGRRDVLIWRPNIIFKNLGLPYTFTRRHAENMRFLAEHGLAGISFGSSGGHWAVQGPQLYLNAKLAWNPKADAGAILSDYYRRAFGPAAPFVAQYFQVYEDLYARLANQYKDQPYSALADPPRLFREIRPDLEPATARLGREGVARNHLIEEEAGKLLEEAASAVESGDTIYRERVGFLRTGFEFIRAQLDCIEAMNDLAENASAENRMRAEAAAAKREAILGAHTATQALNFVNILAEMQAAPRHLGPPSRKAPAGDGKKKEQKALEDLEA